MKFYSGSVQCCNLNEEKQISTGKNDALISTGDIASQVGVQVSNSLFILRNLSLTKYLV